MSFEPLRIKLPPTETEAGAMRVAREMLERGARQVRKGFTEPDDDWHPIWLVMSADGTGDLLTGDLHKHAMTDLVAAYARKTGAVAVGHLHSSWLIEDATPEVHAAVAAAGGSTEGFERSEVVLLMTYTASLAEGLYARITRNPRRPPMLGAFGGVPGLLADGEVKYHGRMMDPLQEALQRLG